MTALTIGKNGFTLPLELVTSTQAILARKRSGKSYTASVQAEELLRSKQQIAAIDPTGAWWGLRSSASGEGPGFPVVVFGGDHADVPLEPHAGRMLAHALVEHGFSAIFDVGLMLTDDQIRFTSDFASELLRINRAALHLYIDEADTFAPQMVESRAQKLCLGTVSRLVKQGGVRGVGVTMITQRPADINKKVLSQVDLLTVLRMSHPLDIAAATDWVRSEVSAEFSREVGEALPSLPVGTAFVCSASLGIGERVEIRARRTFNSGATPAPGERKTEPKVLAAVDVKKLGREIAESAQRTQETSPDFLQRRIAELERAANGNPNAEALGKLAQLEEEVARLKPVAERAAELVDQLRILQRRHDELLGGMRALVEGKEVAGTGTSPAVPAPVAVVADPISMKTRTVVVAEPKAGLSTSEQKILDALASLDAVGVREPTKTQLAAFAGYSNPKSGGFAAPAAVLVRKGLMESNAGRAVMTPAGGESANRPTVPATTKELQERIATLLGEGERKLLTILIASYPEPLIRVDLATLGGYSNPKSGGFAAPLARLIELGFAESVRSGVVRGSDMLFLKKTSRGGK